MPDAWVERYNALNVRIRRGPGIKIRDPKMLTPVNADDGAFDVRYEVHKNAENPKLTTLGITVRSGGANGEITAGAIWANGAQMQDVIRGDGGQDAWEISASRPFVFELTLAPVTEWPNRKPPVVSGPFAAVTEVRLQKATGRLTCVASFQTAKSLSWRQGNLYLEEITAEDDHLNVRLRSPTPPEL
jgi:hypothetical protein